MTDQVNCPKVDVLDYGYVRLIECSGSDLSIVRAARVSYDAAWRAGEDTGSDWKLIHYLMRNRHTSPFESVHLTFEVKAPIFVFRQWHRHRTWSYNEVSARYTALPEEYYVPEPDQIGMQSKSNKQMRTLEEREDAVEVAEYIDTACSMSHAHYKKLIERGIPRELARGVLPMNTYSTMFATVNLHNLFHFLRLRMHEHAQYEIRVYAEAILQLLEETPLTASVSAFKESIGYEADETDQSD
jgi:thymidylate synthase (FAD)